MITGVSGLAAASGQGQVSGAQATNQTAAVTSAASGSTQGASSSKPKGDSVKVSLAAQAHALKRQGHSMTDISNKLKVDPKTLASYFK